jgi:hypothetical protein
MRLMTGYMIYDLLIELFTPETLNLEVLFHHIVGLVSRPAPAPSPRPAFGRLH